MIYEGVDAMTELIKEEEEFLKLLLEQDWENDIQAYLKFREKLPESLAIQYGEIIESLKEKGYIRKKDVRKFILSESAKIYFKDKKKNKIKDICVGLYKIKDIWIGLYKIFKEI